MPQVAFADDPGQAALPSIDELFKGVIKTPYLTTYRMNYYLDMVEYNSLMEPTGAFNELANLLFLVQSLAGYILVVAFYYAFEFPIYDIFSGVVETFVGEMKVTLFDELSLLAISFLGLYFVIKMYQDQKTQIWVAIVQTIIIVALAMMFFTQPIKMLNGIDSFSKDISTKVLAGSYKASNKGENPNSAVAAAADDIWQMFVHKPWQLLEFGNMKLAKDYENRILSLSPLSEARKKIIEDIAKDEEHFTVVWGLKRLGFMILYTIPMALMFIVIIFLSALMIAYQILTLFYALGGVFIFILALIPFFGTRIIQSWFLKLVGTGGIKVIVAFCLGILMAFNSALFKLMDAHGWFVILFMQIAVAVVIIWKKDAIFDTFTTMRLAPQNAGALNKQIRKDTNIESYIKDYSRNMGMRKNKDYGYAYSYGGDGFTEDKGYEDSYRPQSFSRTVERVESPSISMSESGSVDKLYNEIQEDTNNDNENFKNLMKKAEEILEKQYEISKQAADEKAEVLKKEPEYTPFVYKVQTREELGAPKFDQREIVSVAQELQRVVRAGGQAEDLYSKDAQKVHYNEVQRPKSVVDIIIDGQKKGFDQDEAQKIILEDKSKDYVDEFNQDYNTKYDKKFMEELIKKYGQEQVGQIIDRMKAIQVKEGTINNPAGYLTQALKNNQRDQVKMRGNKGEDPFEK